MTSVFSACSRCRRGGCPPPPLAGHSPPPATSAYRRGRSTGRRRLGIPGARQQGIEPLLAVSLHRPGHDPPAEQDEDDEEKAAAGSQAGMRRRRRATDGATAPGGAGPAASPEAHRLAAAVRRGDGDRRQLQRRKEMEACLRLLVGDAQHGLRRAPRRGSRAPRAVGRAAPVRAPVPSGRARPQPRRLGREGSAARPPPSRGRQGGKRRSPAGRG